MIHVAIYNEYIHERESECVAAVYPQGIHAVIADFLRSDEIDVKCFTLDTVSLVPNFTPTSHFSHGRMPVSSGRWRNRLRNRLSCRAIVSG